MNQSRGGAVQLNMIVTFSLTLLLLRWSCGYRPLEGGGTEGKKWAWQLVVGVGVCHCEAQCEGVEKCSLFYCHIDLFRT